MGGRRQDILGDLRPTRAAGVPHLLSLYVGIEKELCGSRPLNFPLMRCRSSPGRYLVDVLVLHVMDFTSVRPNRSCCAAVRALADAEPPIDNVSTSRSEPITNAFFMESPRSPESSAPLAEPLFGVLRLALEADLEIEARSLE